MYREGPNSVTQWIADLKAGDAEAARRLAERYWRKLEVVARTKMGTLPRGMVDEEDVVVSVFESLCRGAAAGRFAELSTRKDLWWLLLAITRRKTIDNARHQGAQKRGGNGSFAERALPYRNSGSVFNLDQVVSREPTPEFLVSLQEEYQRLLSLLRDDTLRRIVTWRMEGYSVEDIGSQLGIGTRSVERKLALIRKKWEREFQA